MRWLITSACGLLLWLSSSACSPLQAQFSSEFDDYFKAANFSYLYGYLPDNNYRWFVAQCYQESLLDPDAVSHAGASGLCQIMPAAAQDAGLSWADRFEAEKNIKAGAFILRRNIRAWWPRPTRMDRLRLAWGSYNWGLGNMLKAQIRCDDAHLWEQMKPCVTPLETRHYVEIIPQHFYRMTQ